MIKSILALSCLLAIAILCQPALSQTGASGAKPATALTTTFRNGFFQKSDGTLFVPLGGFYGNLVPEIRDGQMIMEPTVEAQFRRAFQNVTEAEWRRWFAMLRDNGCNTIRI